MGKKTEITIQDIAERANVSISTVSRVLNNSLRVREKTRAAVLQAAAELNYKPNVFAQSLASGQSMTVGVLTQSISSPVYDAILRGVLQGLENSAYTPIFADGNWQRAREQGAVEMFLKRRVDGLIILGGDLPDSFCRQLAEQVPLVIFGRSIAGLEAQCLQLDNFAGGYLATRHLIELGHRRIAHVTGILAHADAVARREGYLRALADNGVPADPELLIEGDFTEQSGVMAVEMLFTRGRTFSAVFAANDQTAYGVRLALYRRGIRVPDDVSIVGFDDIPYSTYATPPLTTVRQPAIEIGIAAAEALVHRIQDLPFIMPEFPAELAIRESTGRAR